MAFDIIITNAGRAALVNATATGTAPVTIEQIGITATAVTPVATATSLPGEIKRIAAIGGVATGADSIHVSLRDETADAYTLRSFALYLADGTLFGIYGQTGAILSKTASVIALIGIDIVFADISSASLTFGATNFTDPDATTSRRGLVELATTAESTAGTDTARAITPAALAGALLSLLLARDGSGSGIDADLLDGQQGSYYADIDARLGYTPVNKAGDTMTGALVLAGDPTGPSQAARKAYVDGLTTAAALLAKLITVDGSGSGLDADLLDGQQGAWYRDLANSTGTLPGARLAGSYPDVLSLTTSGTLAGILHHLSGYLEVLPYSEIYDDGSRARAYYDGISRQLRINGMDSTGTVVPISLFVAHSPVWSGANDGSGSGLDADMLDGKHASAFANATDFSTGSNTRGRWWKQPDGAGSTVIEQQGRIAGRSTQGTLTITFPIAFTDTDYDLQMTTIIPGAADYDNYVQEVDGTRSLTGVTIFAQDPAGGASTTISGVRWRAKGY